MLKESMFFKLQLLLSSILTSMILLSFLFFTQTTHAQQIPNPLSVSAVVPPQTDDYQLTLTGSEGSTVRQNTTITYEITYGASSSAGLNVPAIIVADWNRDTAADGTHVLEYVSGSADKAYGNTPPVIDLLNRTITWHIPSLPSGITDKTVIFKLKTKDFFQTNPVDFTVQARLTTEHITFPVQAVTKTYQYKTEPQKTVSNPAAPTVAPTLTPAAVPFNPPQISAINITALSQSSVTLSTRTNTPTKLLIRYGTSSKNLSESLSTAVYETSHTITLDSLPSDTTYYFQIIAIAANGRRTTSELFTFKTAQVSEQPMINPHSLVITSSDMILYSSVEQQGTPTVVIPQNLPYSFRFALTKPQPVTSIQVDVRNKSVLGITSDENTEPNRTAITLSDQGNSIFVGRLNSSLNTGMYELYARITDPKGNLVETKLTNIRIIPPLTITDENHTPLEAAQVLLYFHNPRTKQYEILSPQILPIKNPSYTDVQGQIHQPLPQGNYKVIVTAIGHERNEVPFTVGPFPDQGYPTIVLHKQSFNLVTLWVYYWTIAADTLSITRLYIQGLSNSLRFFELSTIVAVATLVFVTLFSFSRRLHIPLRSLIEYFSHLGKIQKVKKVIGNKIQGRVFDEQGTPLPQTDVYLIDVKTDSIVGHTETNLQGSFSFTKLPGVNYSLQVMKEAYEPATFLESEIHAVDLGGYLLTLQRHPHGLELKERIVLLLEKLLALLFETLLVISFIFEVSLGYALGWTKVLPFLLISLINVSLWLIHLMHLRRQKNIF